MCVRAWHGVTHPGVEVSDLSRRSVFVRDLDVLVTARVHHHVPGVAVQAVGPVVVALGTGRALFKTCSIASMYPDFASEIISLNESDGLGVVNSREFDVTCPFSCFQCMQLDSNVHYISGVADVVDD